MMHFGVTMGTLLRHGRHIGADQHHGKNRFTVSVAQAMECEGALWESHSETKIVGLRCSFDASKPVELVKHVGVVSSLHVATEQCPTEALREANEARALGYEALKAEHEKAWEEIWAFGDIEIGGDVEAQQAIRFNIFHLNQTYRGDDARLNVGPKGSQVKSMGVLHTGTPKPIVFRSTWPRILHTWQSNCCATDSINWARPLRTQKSWGSGRGLRCTRWSP